MYASLQSRKQKWRSEVFINFLSSGSYFAFFDFIIVIHIIENLVQGKFRQELWVPICALLLQIVIFSLR